MKKCGKRKQPKMEKKTTENGKKQQKKTTENGKNKISLNKT